MIASEVDIPDWMIGSQAGLGRIISSPDTRNENYVLPRSTTLAREKTSRYYLSLGAAFDQGGTSQCVDYSANRVLVTHSTVNKAVLPFGTLYQECKLVDEWPGENYDGTSVHAAMKVLKTRGLIERYDWATSAEAVMAHVLAAGPVLMGTTWTMDMFTPDKHGYIWFTGEPAGGHAWAIIGASRKRKNPDGSLGAFQMMNSWGSRWGLNGRAWLTFDTVQTLIEDYGEAAAPREVKIDY